MSWGTLNVDTASRDLYDDIIEKREDLFPKRAILFEIAAAVALKKGETKELEGETHTLAKTSEEIFDPSNILESLIMEKIPRGEKEEQLKMLEEYAERGIEIIHEKIMKTGTFDIESYID